ncbi:MAG: hypothetical protein AAGC97_01240 [Planctomycetota bacterium]
MAFVGDGCLDLQIDSKRAFSIHQRSKSLRVAVLLAALIIRGSVVLLRPDALDSDPDAYRALAESLHATGTFGLIDANGTVTPTAFRPPLYPWLLSWLVDDTGVLTNRAVGGLHVFLGALTSLITWDIATRLLRSIKLATVAMLLVAVDPILLVQSTLVMTETLAVMLVTLVWWCWVHRIGGRHREEAQRPDVTPTPPTSTAADLIAASLLGIVLTMCILCRPTFLVWTGLLIAAFPWTLGAGQQHRWAMIVVTVLIIGGGIGAWTARNQVRLGAPVWATSHGGYTLWLGNNESFFDYVDRSRRWESWLPWNRRPWDATEFLDSHLEDQRRLVDDGQIKTEMDEDAWAYGRAKQAIENRPATFAWACLLRVTRLWHPFPMRVPGRALAGVLLVGCFYMVVEGLVIFAVIRHGWRWKIAWWPAFALVLTLTGVHTAYWSNARMRSPVTPMFAVAAMAGLVRRYDETSTIIDQDAP